MGKSSIYKGISNNYSQSKVQLFGIIKTWIERLEK